MISFDEYQNFVATTGFYPGKRTQPFVAPDMGGVSYTALGLTGEAGEVADKVKKILRDHEGALDIDTRDGLIKELGDVLWYLSAMANELEISLETVAQTNVNKIRGRNARGTRQGSGDDR